MARRILIFVLALALLLSACASPATQQPTAPEAPMHELKIVASTSWVGAFALAAGAEDISIIAPSNIQHPPDYDPKPSDLEAVSSADYVLYAGFEGFAPRMQEAVGGSSDKLITVATENSPESIHKEVTRLGELFGTQDKAAAFLETFDAEYAKLSDEVKAAVGDHKPVVVAQMFVSPFVFFAGLEPAGMYGPMPMTPDELKTLSDAKPTMVFENAHMGGGDPLVEATGATKVDLINFPGDDMDLLSVFRTNAETLKAAFGSMTESHTHSHAEYPVTIENCGRTLIFEKAPERVISMWQPPTEMLLALGLEDRIVALAGSYAPYATDELQTKVDNIEVIGTSMMWPAKEVTLSHQSDFVLSELIEGYAFDGAQGYATVAELEAAGAQVYSNNACTMMDIMSKKVENVYTDLSNLGKIFGVSDKAEAVIADMQVRQAAVEAKIAGQPKIKVAFYNGGTGPIGILSGGFWGDVISRAGGENVFPPDSFSISVEEFAAAQPDVILVGYYPGLEVEDSIDFLKQTFPNIPAVKNNRFVPIADIEVEASVRFIDGLEAIAKGLYPDLFK